MEAVEVALEDADEIDHSFRAAHRAPHLLGLANVGGGKLNLAKPAEWLQVKGGARIAAGDADARAVADE